MPEQPEIDDWDGVSFVLSSEYRQAVVEQLQEMPATPSKIAEDAGISISHVSRALRQLSEKEFVKLLVSDDRRKGRIYGLTEEGSNIAEGVEQVA